MKMFSKVLIKILCRRDSEDDTEVVNGSNIKMILKETTYIKFDMHNLEELAIYFPLSLGITSQCWKNLLWIIYTNTDTNDWSAEYRGLRRKAAYGRASREEWTPSPYIPWNNSPLEKNPMAEQGVELNFTMENQAVGQYLVSELTTVLFLGPRHLTNYFIFFFLHISNNSISSRLPLSFSWLLQYFFHLVHLLLFSSA